MGIFPAVWNEWTMMPSLQYVPGLCQKLPSANVTLTFTRRHTDNFSSGCQTFGTVNRVLCSVSWVPKAKVSNSAVERAFNRCCLRISACGLTTVRNNYK